MLTHRLQVLIDEERYDRLQARARESGVSIGQLVREAIDTKFPRRSPERSAAAEVILDARRMEVPDPAELKRELDEARGRRG